MQTIRWHAENHQAECAGALSDLLPNMYVDDLVVSCDSVADARRIAKEATELLGKGGFHIAKRASNSPAAVDGIPAKDQEPSDASRLWKTLGIFWQRESDVLSFRPPERVAEFPVTKRGVLKALASVFDPLGCLAPYTVRAKIIIQLLWQCGVSWDDPLPPETKAQWRTWTVVVVYVCTLSWQVAREAFLLLHLPSGKRETERKGNAPVNTGPSPNSNECTISAVEEADEHARGSGPLQWGPVREMMPLAYRDYYYFPPPAFHPEVDSVEWLERLEDYLCISRVPVPDHGMVARYLLSDIVLRELYPPQESTGQLIEWFHALHQRGG
ncbi:hypothetical protein T07_12964 [Trichinella nelsoni]|uniref:Reverse transcriptase domain-containing protein n=1 Tax=Trichinella nelsoni TaxID=6336 RepID=A0A0V0SI69_9BILA|nr:hypothetical protein T07_12964 [Trichinella nelsoni]